MSSATIAAIPPPPNSSSWSAALPKIESHTKVRAVGTSSTPTRNSRTVRPRDTLAMNIPTKGDQAIHHAQ